MIFTQPKISRAISAVQLAEMAGEYASQCRVVADAEKALEAALNSANPNDAIFVTGSLYLVGQLRHYWQARTQAIAG